MKIEYELGSDHRTAAGYLRARSLHGKRGASGKEAHHRRPNALWKPRPIIIHSKRCLASFRVHLSQIYAGKRAFCWWATLSGTFNRGALVGEPKEMMWDLLRNHLRPSYRAKSRVICWVLAHQKTWSSALVWAWICSTAFCPRELLATAVSSPVMGVSVLKARAIELLAARLKMGVIVIPAVTIAPPTLWATRSCLDTGTATCPMRSTND